jgi:hypothetical protein
MWTEIQSQGTKQSEGKEQCKVKIPHHLQLLRTYMMMCTSVGLGKLTENNGPTTDQIFCICQIPEKNGSKRKSSRRPMIQLGGKYILIEFGVTMIQLGGKYILIEFGVTMKLVRLI